MADLTNWPAPVKPAELTYSRLIDAVLDGTFPANSTLPGERQLAELLGVTRSTLREALQRLAGKGAAEPGPLIDPGVQLLGALVVVRAVHLAWSLLLRPRLGRSVRGLCCSMTVRDRR
mgnify:CR=1 FL=1